MPANYQASTSSDQSLNRKEEICRTVLPNSNSMPCFASPRTGLLFLEIRATQRRLPEREWRVARSGNSRRLSIWYPTIDSLLHFGGGYFGHWISKPEIMILQKQTRALPETAFRKATERLKMRKLEQTSNKVPYSVFSPCCSPWPLSSVQIQARVQNFTKMGLCTSASKQMVNAKESHRFYINTLKFKAFDKMWQPRFLRLDSVPSPFISQSKGFFSWKRSGTVWFKKEYIYSIFINQKQQQSICDNQSK